MKYDYENENVTQEYKVEESASKYYGKQQGEYTLEDYYALPDDVRGELIDGTFYNMTAPRLIHQELLFDIARLLANQIEERGGSCKVFVAPLDVRLDCDDKTMVQPDVIILCDMDKLGEWGICGAPDFVLEVLSPSTRKKDMFLKLKKYRNAGVREYWIVDPKKKLLYIYDFEYGKESIHPLEGKLGLAMYQEEIYIDLGKLEKFFLEREIQRSRKTAKYSIGEGHEVMKVEEDSLAYLSKQQGEYTVEDFFHLPYDRWAELIDGSFYEMEKPCGEHEELAVDILTQIYPQVKAYGDGVFTFRTCLQLDGDDKTMVLPDFMILCDKKRWKNRVIYGAPDFVLEVLSPSTRKKDLTIKHRKYLNAGVREYWIIDPKEKRLITYDFENGENVASYPFTEVVGLSIYDKQIVLDLTELAEIVEE